jgi:polyisoprenoid-binding protein YceI
MIGVLSRRWELMTTLSSAGFTVRNLGRTVHGRVPIRHASVEVDGAGRPTSVHAELDLASVDTAHARRDRDLRKPHLLDTGRFPTMTFTSTSVEADGDSWLLPGRLAGCGGEIDLVLTATARHDGDQVTVHATASFDRRELGIRAPRIMIGRRIDVLIEAALRPAAEA